MTHRSHRLHDDPFRGLRVRPADPVIDSVRRPRSPGIGLCLSGGGYRAMLFHAGALWRLNAAGYLPRLRRISAVSGGSIMAAMLGIAWRELGFNDRGVSTRFEEQVIGPIRALADETLDGPAIVGGILLPGSIGDRFTNSLEDVFGRATLQDLPASPDIVFNATSVQSGALWRFSRAYAGDYRVGRVLRPTFSVAQAVAASAAFPPFLSPVTVSLPSRDVRMDVGNDLHEPPFTTTAVLTDGGVYDNLGLETVYKNYGTVLVSDAGGAFRSEPHPSDDWVRHSRRVLDMISNQVRSLRKRQLIAAFKAGQRRGAYWGIRSDIRNYRVPSPLPSPIAETTQLADIPTRLAALDELSQMRLINWGFAICDAALRKHVDKETAASTGFPYAAVGLSKS